MRNYITRGQKEYLLRYKADTGSWEAERLYVDINKSAVSAENGTGNLKNPRMADLPPARLCFYQPAFYSAGVDCFSPFIIKMRWRNEKRWRIIFKCMITRAVYIDVLTNIGLDSLLMVLHWSIACRGKPHYLFSDQGANFKGGEQQLSEAFTALQPTLQS